jgi:Fe-S cluster assembly protein SufB
MPAVQETIDQVRKIDVDQYKYGFETVIESDKAPKGLNEDTIRFISAKKNEPEWMLEWRLDAYKRWLTMEEPNGRASIIRRSIFRTSTIMRRRRAVEGPKRSTKSIRNCLRTYEKLGIPLREQEILAGVQAMTGSPSTRCSIRFGGHDLQGRAEAKAGVIFCSISEAMREYPNW